MLGGFGRSCAEGPSRGACARMILACPDCATRYFVGDDAVPPTGRIVRCAACAAEWRALPDGVEPLTLAPPPEPPPPAKPAPVSSQLRAKARAKKETQAAAAVGVVWAGLGVGLAAVLGLAVLFRVDVVRLWPRTAGAYAAVKLPVNPVGLVPENVSGGPGLQNGRAVMVVTGSLRNVTTASRPSALLKVSLFDKAGHALVAHEMRAPGGPIAPGEARAFSATFLDPPLAAAEFGVDFAFEPKPTHAQAAATSRGHTALHAADPHAPPHPAPAHPAPATHEAAVAPTVGHVPEAAPLPADSPYALHPAPHG